MQTLFAQLFFAIPVLLVAYLIFEFGAPVRLSTEVVLAFGYQSVAIAFFSYFLWFWMIHRYMVSRLTAFTFLVPIFGVLFSGIVLGESLPLPLWGGLALVACGIYLVNRPEKVKVT